MNISFKNWMERFDPQKEFPFMHEPGYYRKATPWLDAGTIEYEKDQYEKLNLYHVTTNLNAVKISGRLLSRKELGYSNIGLGGGFKNEAPDKVSTTYSLQRAQQIYGDLELGSEIAHGKYTAEQIVNYFDLSDDYLFEKIYQELRLSKSDKEKFYNGDYSVLNKYYKTPQELYELFQTIEQKVSEDELSKEQDFTPLITSGLTASFENMSMINPKNIAILQVVATKDANPEHIPLEQELRFLSEHLRIVRVIDPNS